MKVFAIIILLSSLAWAANPCTDTSTVALNSDISAEDFVFRLHNGKICDYAAGIYVSCYLTSSGP